MLQKLELIDSLMDHFTGFTDHWLYFDIMWYFSHPAISFIYGIEKMLEMDINGCKRCWHKTCPRNLWVMAFHSFSFSAASLVISFNADLWTLLSFISFTLVHEIFATFEVSCKRKAMLPVTFFSHTWPNSCYYCFFLSLFIFIFLFYLTIFCLFFLHICSLGILRSLSHYRTQISRIATPMMAHAR